MKIKYIAISMAIIFPLSLSANDEWSNDEVVKALGKEKAVVSQQKQQQAQQDDDEVSAMEAALGLPSKAFTVGTPKEKKAKIKRVAKKYGLTRSPRSGAQIDHRMVFSTGSAALNTRTKSRVDKLARVYKGNAKIIKQIIITGHTDVVGDDNSNRVLSDERANSVKQELIQQGVPASKILAKGYGESQLLPNVPGTSSVNRRVEYSVKK